MDEITFLSNIQWWQVVVGVIAIIVAIKAIVTVGDYFTERFGIELRSKRLRNEETELVQTLSERIKEIEKRQYDDEQMSLQGDAAIKEDIKSLTVMVNDLTSNMNEVVTKLDNIDSRLDVSQNATMESMRERIEQKCNHYINELHGIPAAEIATFGDMFAAYQKLGGNHIDTLVNRCLNELPVLPTNATILK